MSTPQARAIALKDQANTLLASKKFGKAIELYSQAIALDPTNHIFYSNRSGANLEIGKLKEAESDARKCVEINPSWVKGHYRLAQALEAQGEHKTALLSYQQALKCDAGNEELQRCIVRCETVARNTAASVRPSILDCYTTAKSLISADVFAESFSLEEYMTCFADAVKLVTHPHKGRGLVAARNVSAGEELFTELCAGWYAHLGDAIGAAVPAIVHRAPWVNTPSLERMLMSLTPFANKSIADLAGKLTSAELFVRVARLNALGGQWEERAGELGHISLYNIAVAMINHSCAPNARYIAKWNAEKRCPEVRVCAVENIAEGQEICISYVTVSDNKESRSQVLRRYGFRCQCPRCDVPYDDTIVVKCPKCTTGRVFIGATTCETCHSDVFEAAAPGGELFRRWTEYHAAPRPLLKLLEDSDDVPVHISDTLRLNTAYKLLGSAWTMEPLQADGVYDVLIPAMQQAGHSLRPSLPQTYLLAGHCAAVAGKMEKAKAYYTQAAQHHVESHGKDGLHTKMIQSLITHVPKSRDAIETFEVRRLETSNWVLADGMPKSAAEQLAQPLDGESMSIVSGEGGGGSGTSSSSSSSSDSINRALDWLREWSTKYVQADAMT